MKLAVVLLELLHARQLTVQDISRTFGGNFLESLPGFERGYNYGGEKSLNGLAMMTVFLDDSKLQRSANIQAFELSIDDFLDKFTNYGCYCWIIGPKRGVIGGGQTVDQIDGLCGELYKCYKCLNLDHGSNDNMFNYNVDLFEMGDGTRFLECQEGENKDACLCDVMFAEKLAQINKNCQRDQNLGISDSPACLNEAFRTANGGGTFDPFDNSDQGCLKVNMGDHNAKDHCCGNYPNRLPYDSMNRECCRVTHNDGNNPFTVDQIVPFSTCEDRGGFVLEEGTALN